MNKKLVIIISIVCAIALCLSVCAIILVCTNAPKQEGTKPSNDKPTDVQYVLYLGTNDKDTNKPVFEPDEAKQKAIEILLKHFGGYTIQEANGGWVDDDKVYTECTLVIYLSDTTIDKIHIAADEMIKVFNQSSILIQANQTTTEFYSGK